MWGLQGGGSMLIAGSNHNRKHYALDSFAGLPDTDPTIDIHETGDFSDVSFQEVKSAASEYENIFLLKGFFTDTFPAIEQEEFSLVYLDADLYQSTLECCDFFYPRLLQGGMMLFDDYLIQSTPGVKKAIDEFFSDKPELPIVLPTCQSLVIKF
jgi:O-methyltransferase